MSCSSIRREAPKPGESTTHAKGYPFEVAIPADRAVVGVILENQVKSIDWRARRARIVDRLDPPTVARILGLLRVPL